MLVTLIALCAAADPSPLVEVVVATRWLEPGVPVEPADVALAQLPADVVPDWALTAVHDVLGRVPKEPIADGALVREERLADIAPIGVDALVPEGMRRVRLALPRPSRRIGAWDLVDVVRLSDDAVCVLAEALRVVAGETADGARQTGALDQAEYVALHLLAPPETAGRFGDLGHVEVWLRSPIDAERTGLASCP